MRTASWCLTLISLAVTSAATALAAPPAEREDIRIADTQLTLRVERAKGQATVIGVADQRLTVMTAAHFLSGEDTNQPVVILRRDVSVPGRIVWVAHNPSFRLVGGKRNSESASKSLGVDTAVAVVEAKPRTEAERHALSALRAAELTPSPFPTGGHQIVSVHIVDQFGTERVLRAGNHLNPKCLAWGRATYVPQHGDSGAGVFIFRKVPEGTSRPLLIGNVSQSDDRGGIASLTHRSADWIEEALRANAGPGERPLEDGRASR